MPSTIKGFILIAAVFILMLCLLVAAIKGFWSGHRVFGLIMASLFLAGSGGLYFLLFVLPEKLNRGL